MGLLWRIALRRGVLGGSQRWFAVAAAIVVVRLFKKVAGNEPKTVFSERLPEGSTLVVSNVPGATVTTRGGTTG